MQLLISNEQKEAAIGEELCSLIQDALEEVLAGGSGLTVQLGDRGPQRWRSAWPWSTTPGWRP